MWSINALTSEHVDVTRVNVVICVEQQDLQLLLLFRWESWSRLDEVSWLRILWQNSCLQLQLQLLWWLDGCSLSVWWKKKTSLISCPHLVVLVSHCFIVVHWRLELSLVEVIRSIYLVYIMCLQPLIDVRIFANRSVMTCDLLSYEWL